MSESEFEAELRTLVPAQPQPELAERVARELREPTEGALRAPSVVPTSGKIHRPSRKGMWRIVQGLGWACAGAAAAIVLLPNFMAQQSKPQPEAAHVAAAEADAFFEPVDSDQEVLAAEEGSVVYDDEEGPTQLVRYSSIERQIWTNGAGASVEVELPREDLLVIPVSYQ